MAKDELERDLKQKWLNFAGRGGVEEGWHVVPVQHCWARKKKISILLSIFWETNTDLHPSFHGQKYFSLNSDFKTIKQFFFVCLPLINDN